MVNDEDALREVSELVDVEKPQAVSHYLYFAKKPDSNLVGELLDKQDFVVTMRLGADGVNWLVHATHYVVPSSENIEKFRSELEELANTYRGEYDGWEVATMS
jgi:hypothetical protein